MKRYWLTAITFLLAFGVAIAQSTDFHISQIYPVNTGHSYVGFSIKYMGFAMVKGRFEKFGGAIRYDESDLNKTSVTFVVDVASIDTGNEWRDDDLKSDNWFDAIAYPQMYFVSRSIKKTGSGFDVMGDLTIKDITKTVSLNMEPPSGVLKDIRGDNQVIFNGGFTLDRTGFGVEGKNWSKVKEGITAVSNEVKIELTILGLQTQEDNFRNFVRDTSWPQGKLYQIAAQEGVEQALKVFEEMRGDSVSPISSGTLGMTARMLLLEKKFELAAPLFEANIKAFPDDSRSYEAYAEALAWAGDMKEAAKYYEMALEKDPGNVHAREVLRHLTP